MPTEHPASNGAPRPSPPARSTDERGRLLPMTDEQRLAMVEEGNRMLDELAEMTATGRGLPK
jgi:hypothetical protein